MSVARRPHRADATPPAPGGVAARPAAVALSYADQGKAPVVVAKGYGATAEAIMRTAREAGVYVHGSGELVGLLMQVDLDRQIPPALYLAVAEVMAWVAQVDARVARAIAPGEDMRLPPPFTA